MTDSFARGQAIGTGDRTTTCFTLVRTKGGSIGPVGWVKAFRAVHLDGSAQAASTTTLATPNNVDLYDRRPEPGAPATSGKTF